MGREPLRHARLRLAAPYYIPKAPVWAAACCILGRATCYFARSVPCHLPRFRAILAWLLTHAPIQLTVFSCHIRGFLRLTMPLLRLVPPIRVSYVLLCACCAATVFSLRFCCCWVLLGPCILLCFNVLYYACTVFINRVLLCFAVF